MRPNVLHYPHVTPHDLPPLRCSLTADLHYFRESMASLDVFQGPASATALVAVGLPMLWASWA